MSKDVLSDEFVISELVRLRRDVDKLLKGRRESNEEAVSIHSNKTTRAQRQALMEHVEKLDKMLKSKKASPPDRIIQTNTFKAGQIVELFEYNPDRSKGKVQYITCKLALPSARAKAESLMASITGDGRSEAKAGFASKMLCDKKICDHKARNYVWVIWPNQKMFAYHFGKLRLMSEDELKPKIGRELSGRVGPWMYDATTKLWKKDGSDKTYTQEEFADIMYFEQNPYAKEDGADFLKQLRKKT
jgi:hypothetical protein